MASTRLWRTAKRRCSLASDRGDSARPSSAAGAIEHLRPLLGGTLLLATDFDGTISRPVTDPWRAAIVPTAQRALRRLAVAPGTHVALISGRATFDLAARVRVGGVGYHGDHGAEWAAPPRGFRPSALRVEREPADPAVAAMAARLCAELPRRVDEPWLVVEHKGPSVTFHFRGAPDTERARERVRAAVDAIDVNGLLDRPGGRRAWELRPPGATTKDRALAHLIERRRPDLVVMLGDDRHDAAAFDVVRTTRAVGTADGLAIAVTSPAGDPAEMARKADLLFAAPDVAARFLMLLARERAGG